MEGTSGHQHTASGAQPAAPAHTAPASHASPPVSAPQPAQPPKTDDISFNPATFKKYLPLILLALFLIFGWYLRSYHLGYPVVGYHNWKETHYLTEARNFAQDGFFAQGFFVPSWDLPFLQEDPEGSHADTFPTISILGGLVFKVFGENLAALRSIGVLLNLASVILLYLIVKQLFKREDLALLTAFLAAMNPLMVFFSRNFQLDSPALFLTLLGTWFYLNWVDKDKPLDGILGVFFMLFGILTKYSFIVMAIPMIPLFPWKKFISKSWWTKDHLKVVISGAVFMVLSFGWIWYMEVYFKNKIKLLYNLSGGGAVISLSEIVQFTVIFSADFWHTMSAFISDNFTMLGIAFAGLGLVLLAVLWKKHKQGALYMLTYAGFGILFFVVLAYKLSGHSYHQFPYAPLIVFLIAYAFIVVGATVASLTRVPLLKWVVVVLLCFALWPQTNAAINRQFDTIFPGLDVAGDFIRQNSQPNERIFHSSQQSYGILWNADRKGYKLPDTLADFQKGEQLNVSWVFIYNWRFNIFQSEDWSYISSHYGLRQAAFIQQGAQFAPVYFLLEKGGSFDLNKINQQLANLPATPRVYDIPDGQTTLQIINVPLQHTLNVTENVKAPVIAKTNTSTSARDVSDDSLG
jgi:4-amino-4-deoxy-L-arabinose transferase-like glycosyltransferase